MGDLLHLSKIADELKIRVEQVEAVAKLLDGAATIPFIARYRKEQTGSLDEVVVTAIRDRSAQLHELEKRRLAILSSLKERKLLTKELKSQIDKAETIASLEDIYLPYRPKRRTRAQLAREKGLEPLARALYNQLEIDVNKETESFINPDMGIPSTEDALAGARDIIAEWINESPIARSTLRKLYFDKALIRSKVVREKENLGLKFQDYFDWSEPALKAPSHRVLAIRRGEKEEVLRMGIAPPEAEALECLEDLFVTGTGPASEQVRLALVDSYKRLLSVALETEIRSLVRTKAEEEATVVFARNLRQLLMAPPLGRQKIMAIDPGFRTGCKVVCLNEQGMLLDLASIFPHSGKKKRERAIRVLQSFNSQYSFDAIAVGNGTAGRETFEFLRMTELTGNPPIIFVNESGASVYSASTLAREEFSDLDVTVRGAISIGRRLMDPLAELVKIDPKSIGVGQYQHDVDQTSLKKSLDDVVISCVNKVGVEVNTASARLLSYVSGIGPKLAENIVTFRNKIGQFSSRDELNQVPKLGPQAFEQAAGFLRISNGSNPLDASAVHPECYPLVDKMASDLNRSVKELMDDTEIHSQIKLESYVNDLIGIPTLSDILQELAKPGRDPRDEFKSVEYTEGVNSIKEVQEGMKLNGVITNVTNFGAFVDVGVHLDGLVHISHLVDRYIKHAGEVVAVGQHVQVRVLAVDQQRKRISLSMREGRDQKTGKKNLSEKWSRRELENQKLGTSRKEEKRLPTKRKQNKSIRPNKVDAVDPGLKKEAGLDPLIKLNRKL
tara:strand:+ start:93153 stop:95504 length:2352 start_codon:yes stop_codon:yes gene_type:complete